MQYFLKLPLMQQMECVHVGTECMVGVNGKCYIFAKWSSCDNRVLKDIRYILTGSTLTTALVMESEPI